MACRIWKRALCSWFLFMFYGALNADEGRYFQITPNKRLITSLEPAVAVVRKDVTSQFECGLWCLRLGKTFCRSFNLEKQTAAKHGRKCELLSVDGNERRDILKKSDDSDYFHLMDACSPNPCKNGGKCNSSDEGTNYNCTCVGHTGQNCECILFDFETGRLDGWTLTGTAFKNQPTYGDNSLARKGIGYPGANLKGDWYIASYENRPSPSDPAGGKQGNVPTGTATSPPFVIRGTKLRLLIGGGSDINTEYVELLIGGSVVAKVGNTWDSDTMVQKEIDVTSKRGQVAQIRVVDKSSVSWGVINVDHIEDSCLE